MYIINNSNITKIKNIWLWGFDKEKRGPKLEDIHSYIKYSDIVKLLFLSCFGYSENFMRDLIIYSTIYCTLRFITILLVIIECENKLEVFPPFHLLDLLF